MNDQTVWKATSKAYPNSPCHFGDPATAKAWAGPGGTVEEITIKGKERTARPLRAVQNWSGMRGDVAFSIIERHADDWADAGEMMEEWLKSNGGTVPNAKVSGRVMTEQKTKAAAEPPLDCRVMPLVETENGNDRLQKHV